MNDLQIFEHFMMLKEKFEKAYEIDFPYFVDINTNLKGRMAGYAITIRGIRHDQYEIRLNAHLLEEYGQAFIDETLTHEVAHIFVDFYYRNDTCETLTHGKEWRLMMRALGVTDIKRCHSYKTKPAKKVRRWLYGCDCQEHIISTVLHNRLLKGWHTRTCTSCGGSLKFLWEKTAEVTHE